MQSHEPNFALPPSLRFLLPLAGYQVLVTDRSGRTLWVNDSFVEVTGFTLDDLRGKTPGECLQGPGTDPATVATLREAVRQGRACAGVEILNYARSGRPLWLRLDIVPVHDEVGRLTHFFSVQSDVTTSRQAADAQAARIDLLLRAGLLGFWQRDVESGEAQWDAVCRRLWGLDEQEPALSLDAAEQRLLPKGREALRRYRRDLVDGATEGEVRYAIRTAAGEHHVRSLWRRQGSLVSGILIDTTSEQALSDEHAQLIQALKLAAPAAQLAFWRHHLASGIVEWLPADSQRIFATDARGCSDAALILESVLEDDRQAVMAARERAQRVRDVVELEYRVRDEQGGIRHLLTRRIGVPGPDAEVAEIIGVQVDVTTQREREMALRRLGAQQGLALRALRAGCYRFDLKERYFELDEAMLRLYGLPPAASRMRFSQWLELVHPDDRSTVLERARALFAQPRRAAPERFRIRHSDGRILWIETDRLPESDADGHIVALVGTHRDVTEEVAAQSHAQALAEAQIAARARAELLATLMHELRTPLNAVTGFAQILQLGVAGREPEPSVADPAHHIQAAGEMMTSLLDDFSDLASADAGVLHWTAERLDVQVVLRECCSWLQQSVRAQARTIHLDVQPSELTTWADLTRTRQILLNLLSNALKYSESDVHVFARRRPSGDVCICVHDEGDGLLPSQLERAFEPFERLGRERGRQPGSGLGLAVCRRLARLMGGDVEVASTPGEGSEFTLILPATRPDPAS